MYSEPQRLDINFWGSLHFDALSFSLFRQDLLESLYQYVRHYLHPVVVGVQGRVVAPVVELSLTACLGKEVGRWREMKDEVSVGRHTEFLGESRFENHPCSESDVHLLVLECIMRHEMERPLIFIALEVVTSESPLEVESRTVLAVELEVGDDVCIESCFHVLVISHLNASIVLVVEVVVA